MTERRPVHITLPHPGIRPPRSAVLIASFSAPASMGVPLARTGSLAERVSETFGAGYSLAETADLTHVSIEDVEATLRERCSNLPKEKVEELEESLADAKKEATEADEARSEAEDEQVKKSNEHRAFVGATETADAVADDLKAALELPVDAALDVDLRQAVKAAAERLSEVAQVLYHDDLADVSTEERMKWSVDHAVSFVERMKRLSEKKWLDEDERVAFAKQYDERVGQLVEALKTALEKLEPGSVAKPKTPRVKKEKETKAVANAGGEGESKT